MKFSGWVLALLVVLAGSARAEHITHARLDRTVAHYVVHEDLTHVLTVSTDWTLVTQRGLRSLDRASYTFYPDKQTLDLVEAWVDQPDGSRVTVPPTSIFTRPTAASQSAPGFTNSQTTTVLFPRLTEGSRTHVVWRLTQNTPSMFGFDAYSVAEFNWDTVYDETRIDIPASVPLTWRARGGFVVTDQTDGGTRHIVATLRGVDGQESEPGMVSMWDFQPLFLVTSLPSYEEIGRVGAREAAGRAAVTPAIQALADRIAGTAQGLDAARAIYNWVTSNIRYVAIYLNVEDGWVPHAADAVLKAGYGDCKDYTVLMQALLAARGIRADMAVLDWGTRTVDPLLWAPYFANHAIVYLPDFDKFLNPTSRYAGFDALDPGLAGKFVVLLTKEGRVMHTPPSNPAGNRYRMHSKLVLAEDGTIKGHADFELTPYGEVGIRAALAGASSTSKLAESLLGRTLEGGFGDLTASNPRDLSRPLSLSADWSSPHAVNPAGRDVFLRVPAGPDLASPADMRSKLSPTGTRRTSLFAEARDYGWESSIDVPASMQVERLPDDVTIANAVGSYTARYRRDGTHGIKVTRNLVIARDVVAAEQYKALEALLYAPIVDIRSVLMLAPAGE
jgi:transglutaminase-like putative cysteine protease